MKRKLVKILSIILIVLAVVFISNVAFAVKGSDLTNQFKGDDTGVSVVTTTEGETLIKDVVGPILSVIRIVAVGISVIMITYLGIHYMSAAPSEKASIKNQLIAFTVGAILVVGATKLLEIVRDASGSIFG